MTEFYYNGEQVSEEKLQDLLTESQKYMIAQEKEIAKKYRVSERTASAIMYLRGRSRWTQEKEDELIERDHAGNPISLGKVLAGEF